MNVSVSFSDLTACLSTVTIEKTLGTAVLVLAAAVFVLAWKMKK